MTDNEQFEPQLDGLAPPLPEREMLEIQAGQLRRWLTQRQRRLDQREAELHARQARMEMEWRNEQLEYRVKTDQISEVERQLQRRADELDQQAVSASAVVVSFETECERIEQASAAATDALASREEVVSKQQKKVEWLQSCQESERAKLIQQQQELAARQVQLDEQSSSMRASLQKSFERLTAAGRSLDERYERISELREDVIAMHHESLRLRAETERLWMQLNPGVEPDIEDSNKERCSDVQKLVHELEGEGERADFRHWYQHRRHELEAQADHVLMRKSSGKT